MEILKTIDADRVRDLCKRGEFFWLDLADPSDDDLRTLGELVTIDSLALEDSCEFGQRAKCDDYPGSALLVFYGAEPRPDGRPRLVEVHLHISSQALVTVFRQPLAALSDAHDHIDANPSAHGGHAVHEVLDALSDSFLSSLEDFDNSIDSLQEALVEHATLTHRRQIFELRRQLAEMHEVVVPQRDLLASGDDIIRLIPGVDRERARYDFRDTQDHLTHAAGLIGTYREQLESLLVLYLTEVSNHLNVTMKRLTLIATVFLPLTFLTGFFGMNYSWLLQRLTSLWTFIAFGIGLPVIASAAVAVYLRRTAR